MATVYLEYTVHLRDAAQVAALQAAQSRIWSPVNGVSGGLVAYPASNGLLFCNPRRAVILYEAELIVNGEAEPPADDPYITTLYFPGPSHTDQFESGADTIVWVGRFAYATSVEQPPVTPFQPFMQRKWICGFNQVTVAAGASGVDGDRVQYGSGRHPGQRGLKISGNNAPATMAHNVLGVAAENTHWERFYLRPRVYPGSLNRFWAINHSLSASRGARLDMSSNGALVVSAMVTGSSVVVATTLRALELHRWYRIDLLIRCSTVDTGPYLRLYIDGVEELNVAFSPTGEGLGENSAGLVFGQSILGTDFTGASIQCDVADWIGAKHPPDITDLQGIDWRHGSKVVPIKITGLGPGGAGNWTGTPLWAERDFAGGLTANDNITNAVNAASLIEFDTDALSQVDENPEAVGGGAVAVVARVNASRGNVNDALLGFALAGANTDTATSMATTLGWHQQAYLPTGLEDPVPIAPFRIRLTRSTGTGTAALRSASAEAEILGFFGPEDPQPTNTPPSSPLPAVVEHNQPYVKSPWERLGAPPVSPVIVKAGSFTGNDTETVLTFRAPVSWLYIRRVTATQTHSLWWSVKGAAARSGYQHIEPDIVRRVTYTWDEEAAEARVVLSGTQVIANDVAATYQYVAVCDPGARYVLNGSVIGPGRTGSVFNPYQFEEWGSTEDGGGPVLAAWFHRFALASGAGTTIAQYFKGPGFGNAVKPFDGTANQNDYALSITDENGITTQGTLHGTSFEEITYSAWKRLDGSSDPNAHKVVNIFSYVGDGSASRTINLAPATGLRPLLVFIVPSNASVPIFRDSSHTGTTSTAIHGTANASTGITGGGIDQINVGSALNTNAVTYACFIIYGGTCNNGDGWSCNDEFEHVTPAPPPKWPIDPTLPEIPPVPPVDPPDPDPEPGPGPDPGPIDFEECPTESQKVCNQALSHIGVTTPIVDIETDLTPEAEQCRLHYEDAVAVVLKRFPWAWATRYAALTLVDGSEDDPVNGDWTYSYRLPSDLVHARRVVNPEYGRDYDPNPIRFRLGHDETGTGLLFCNEINEDDQVELEYTYRPGCSALVGDAIFREALTWYVASKLAPGLARNKMKASDCLEIFEYWLAEAKVQNAREQQQDPTSSDDAPWIRGRE